MTVSAREPSNPLTPDDLRAEVAYLRAEGRSWDEVAKSVGRDAAELRRATRRDPHFAAELEHARSEAEQDAEAALLARLRRLVASDDPEQAVRAVNLLTRHLAGKRRDETRRAVERSRAKARAARAAAEESKTARDPQGPPRPAAEPAHPCAGDRREADTPPEPTRDKSAPTAGKPADRAGPPPGAPEPPKRRVAPEG